MIARGVDVGDVGGNDAAAVGGGVQKMGEALHQRSIDQIHCRQIPRQIHVMADSLQVPALRVGFCETVS